MNSKALPIQREMMVALLFPARKGCEGKGDWGDTRHRGLQAAGGAVPLNRKNRAAKCNYIPSTGVVSVTEPMTVKVLGI